MKTFDFETPYATYRDCYLRVCSYSYNPLCLAVRVENQEDGPITTLTVNLGEDIGNDSIIRENQAFVDVNNNETAAEFLAENGIAEPVTRFGEPVVGYSGWCAYPLYAFNPEILEEADPVGWAEHMKLYQENWEVVRKAMFD